MQAAVERVIRSLILKPAMSDHNVDAEPDEATEFASQLLQNYKDLLAQRSRGDGNGGQ